MSCRERAVVFAFLFYLFTFPRLSHAVFLKLIVRVCYTFLAVGWAKRKKLYWTSNSSFCFVILYINSRKVSSISLSQLTFICSKLTIETLEKSGK